MFEISSMVTFYYDMLSASQGNQVTPDATLVVNALLAWWTINAGVEINKEIQHDGNHEKIRYIFLGLITALCFMSGVLSNSWLKITTARQINGIALVHIVCHHQDYKRWIRGGSLDIDVLEESSNCN
ncbi:hypothetical protein ACH5RR_026131 [Cinchona calisaya]|uniref:Uncharacterized protein n=1 Tax=Cinchona calisaya TaxID=153742 RepID=A0ABD2Z3V5_9GENT